MKGYINGSIGSSITVHYNAYIEASMQGYSNGSFGSSITVHYNG
jgi:hypothetical protein